MRLSEFEIKSIKSAIKNYFEPKALVYLFGSRLDDSKYGGDIDLYVETMLTGEELIKAKLQAISEIQFKIGERKIDIVTAKPNSSSEVPLIIHKARESGVAL